MFRNDARARAHAMIAAALDRPDPYTLAANARGELARPVLLLLDPLDAEIKKHFKQARTAAVRDLLVVVLEAEAAARILKAVGSPACGAVVRSPPPIDGTWLVAVVQGHSTAAVLPFTPADEGLPDGGTA